MLLPRPRLVLVLLLALRYTCIQTAAVAEVGVDLNRCTRCWQTAEEHHPRHKCHVCLPPLGLVCAWAGLSGRASRGTVQTVGRVLTSSETSSPPVLRRLENLLVTAVSTAMAARCCVSVTARTAPNLDVSLKPRGGNDSSWKNLLNLANES